MIWVKIVRIFIRKESTNYKWMTRFKIRRDRVEDVNRIGRPSIEVYEEIIDNVRHLMERDSLLTIGLTANTTDMSIGSAYEFLSDKN